MAKIKLTTSDGAIISLDEATVQMFASSLHGRLISAVDPGYDARAPSGTG